MSCDAPTQDEHRETLAPAFGERKDRRQVVPQEQATCAAHVRCSRSVLHSFQHTLSFKHMNGLSHVPLAREQDVVTRLFD